MATIWGFMPPAAVLSGDARTPDAQTLPFTGTNAVDDFLILNAGVLAKAATNAAVGSLAGIALKPSTAIYASSPATAATLFGASTLGTALTPGYPLQMDIFPLYGGSFVQMSLNQIWNPGVTNGPGTAVGLTLDGGTGFFVADSTQANKIGTIVAWVVLAAQQGAAVGDTGLRAVIQINAPTALG